jgi:hypothetical protein
MEFNNLMTLPKIHHYIFLAGTAMLVIGLPVSQFLLSVSILLLSLNWVTELILLEIFRIYGTSDRILTSLKRRKALWLFLSIYLIHVIWLLNTNNFVYAFHDLRIKLPLLALPIIYGTSGMLTQTQFKIILQLFAATVFVSSLISTYVILGFSNIDLLDPRYASLFISHIRFSLIVVLIIYTLAYLALFWEIDTKPWERKIYMVGIFWFICFLILLQSFTGIVIFLILLPIALIWWASSRQKKKLVLLAYISSGLIVLLVGFYSVYSFNRFHKKHDVNNAKLETHTINGNSYCNQPKINDYENGYTIWIYISEKELRQEWNKRSEINYDSLDRKGQSLKTTLIRYLTSLGYRKDSVAISKLDAEDISLIENGYTNYLSRYKFALYPRIYVLLWEIEHFQKTGDPSGQSLGQRIEYLKTGIHILKRHFWFGTGTGDVNKEFRVQYKLDISKLKPEWQHRTHNQFITFFLTFGIFGFIWFLCALVMPPIIEYRHRNFLFTSFFLIGILSMLNEDTLETHVGVSFFAFFYSFLLFSMPKNATERKEKT